MFLQLSDRCEMWLFEIGFGIGFSLILHWNLLWI
eukprot:UN23037